MPTTSDLVGISEYYNFTSNRKLRNVLEQRRKVLQENNSDNQYVFFIEVPQQTFFKLDEEERNPIVKSTRFTYNLETGFLQAKVRLSD